MLLSGVNMLNTMRFHRFADVISDAVYNVYEEGAYLTTDVGGKATTSQFVDRVIQEIKKIK